MLQGSCTGKWAENLRGKPKVSPPSRRKLSRREAEEDAARLLEEVLLLVPDNPGGIHVLALNNTSQEPVVV